MSIESSKLMNLADGKVLYDDLRQRAESVVEVSSTEPTSESNKIWIDDTNSPTGVQVPTYAELTELSSALQQKYTKPDTGIPASDLASGVIPTVPVQDVQVNGTSVVNDGVAEIPVASTNDFGAVKVGNGLQINNGIISVNQASASQIKAGTNTNNAIVPFFTDATAFYGLAKASGDTTQSASSNAVGTYTESAKASIRSMLGVASAVELEETVSGSTPSITGQPNVRYLCGECATLSITPPSNGTIDVFFTSGTTATVLTVPSTVKFPSWFDATSLEASTIYEIMITNGVYGVVMTWAS